MTRAMLLHNTVTAARMDSEGVSRGAVKRAL